MARLDPSSIKRGKDEQQLDLSYRDGPLASTATERTATLAVGDRAPDAKLDAHGTPIRLFDLYRGPHFTAVAYGPRAARDLDQLRWPTDGAALRRIAIDGDGDSADHTTLKDTAGSFRKNYGTDSQAIVLIRPDGYVAAMAKTDIPATITSAVAALAPSPHQHSTVKRPR